MLNKVTGKKEIDLLDYWKIVLKRKWVIVTVTAVLLAAAAVISFTTTPQFEASTTILIEEPGSQMLTIEDILKSTTGGGNDWQGTYFNTQLRILQSRTLAERVAKKMNLAARPELLAAPAGRNSLVDLIKSVISLRWLAGRKALSAEGSPENGAADASAAYSTVLLAGLTVAPIPDTRLVTVSFTSPSPRLAADVVNSLAEEFINFSIESRSEATRQTADFLTRQIAETRDELQAKERDLQKYGNQKKIIQLSDKDSSIVSEWEQIDKAYGEAQVARINAETNYLQMRGLRVDALPQVINNPTIQSLRTSLVQIQGEYAEKSKTLGPNNPDLIAIKTRLDTTKSQLEGEIGKAVEAAKSEFETAQARVVTLARTRESKRTEISGSNQDAILYKTLQSEIANKRNLLNTLQAKQEETGVSARLSGLGTSNIKIVDPALTPDIPVSPNTRRNLLVALLLGLICGVGLAFVADFLDNSVKGPEDLEKMTGLPSLGIVPHFNPAGSKKGPGYASRYESLYGAVPDAGSAALAQVSEVELINFLFPKISISEDYRTIRTAILFSRSEDTARTIAFTSTSPQEGKSATLANMAISFSQLGDRVLAVDADLRKPRQHKIFQVSNLAGLSGYLTGRASLEDAIQKTAIDKLWILPSGPHPPNPAELLNSRKMKELMTLLKQQFDVVLIDTPPVLAVIDPVIVASVTDGTILVVRTAKTTRKPLLKSLEELRKAKAAIIGVIFNDAKARREALTANYFQYEYYQDKSIEEPARAGQPKDPDKP